MPIHESEAVVLRQYPLGEADRIIVLFAKEHGKVRGVAKGSKKPGGHMGGCLEPLNHVTIRYFMKEGSDLGRINHCELVHSYLGLCSNLDKIYIYSYFSEILNEMVQDNNPNQLLFRLFIASLNAGEKGLANEALIHYFEIWSLRLNGLLPGYETCSGCGKCVKNTGFYAWLDAGQARCADCAGNRGSYISPAAGLALSSIGTLSPEEFAARPYSSGVLNDLENIAQKHMERHMEKRMKSYPAWKAIIRSK